VSLRDRERERAREGKKILAHISATTHRLPNGQGSFANELHKSRALLQKSSENLGIVTAYC